MNIHLIRSGGFDEDSFADLVDLLQKFEGPLKFSASSYDPKVEEEKIWREELDEEEYSKKKMPAMDAEYAAMSAPMEFPVERFTASKEDLLAECTAYRKEEDLGDEEFVILFTDLANELNWFSYGSDDAKDIFIHTEGWDYFVDSDLRFPLAHQVATNILQKLMFGTMQKLMEAVHEYPLGCINDFCQHKKDISLKMRTGDICPDCQGILQETKVPPALINQALNIIESIRSQMLFKERFRYNLQPSRMEVRGIDRRIYLTDLEDYKVKLTPLERTVYLFFLDHPKGVKVNSLFEHEKALYDIYRWVSTAAIDSSVAAMHNSIAALADPLGDSLAQKISKANRKFKDAVGEDMAQHYMILKDPVTERHKIALDRDLLSYAKSVKY